jgi:ABC-type uncharacterized transport system fused permease/ATPase subunit
MHRPELLMLDELTAGLDPLMQQEVYRLFKEARADGATVLILLAWWRFQRRDIRLGGERSWNLPAQSRLLRHRGTSEQEA